MKRNEKMVVVYLISLLLCIFCMTLMLLIQGFARIIYIGIYLLTLAQAAGLIWYLHEERPPKNVLLRVLLKLNTLTVLATVGTTVYLYLTMAAQFHAVLVPDASGDIATLDMNAVESAENCYVFQSDNLYIFFPQYQEIEFVFGDCPSMADPDLTLFATSAFFSTYELAPRHMNVVGAHAIDGVYFDGAEEDHLSAFTFYDGEARFAAENPDEAVRTAAEHGGDGFEQFMVLLDGVRQWDILAKRRCYRVLAELNGKICLIECQKLMPYADFVSAVQALGVQNAIYLDMGAHSSYSQYRDNSGNVINLFGKRGEFVHTWIAFRK